MAKRTKLLKSETAKASAPRIDIAQGKQVNGAMEGETSIMDVLRKRNYPYKDLSLAEYTKTLSRMNLSDLQRHAIEVAQILPNITDRSRLVDKLEREFLRRHASFTTSCAAMNTNISNLTPEREAAIKEVLSRHRTSS